jgi:hypothetical protein
MLEGVSELVAPHHLPPRLQKLKSHHRPNVNFACQLSLLKAATPQMSTAAVTFEHRQFYTLHPVFYTPHPTPYTCFRRLKGHHRQNAVNLSPPNVNFSRQLCSSPRFSPLPSGQIGFGQSEREREWRKRDKKSGVPFIRYPTLYQLSRCVIKLTK